MSDPKLPPGYRKKAINFARELPRMTLHGPVPVETTMALAMGVTELDEVYREALGHVRALLSVAENAPGSDYEAELLQRARAWLAAQDKLAKENTP